GTAGLARSRVSGSSRWPLPPARITVETLLRAIIPLAYPRYPRLLVDLHFLDVRNRAERPAQLIHVHLLRAGRRDRHLELLLHQVPLQVDFLDPDVRLTQDPLELGHQRGRILRLDDEAAD